MANNKVSKPTTNTPAVSPKAAEVNLMEASKQWATRPDDERFWNLDDLHKSLADVRQHSLDSTLSLEKAEIVVNDQRLMLTGGDRPYDFTSWSFNQLCDRVHAPAQFVRELSAPTAAVVLNEKIRNFKDADKDARMLVYENGSSAIVRATNGLIYSRLWNAQVSDWLQALPKFWRVPPARPAREGQGRVRVATKEDILRDKGFGLSIKVGDLIAPAGVYASNEDMFVFMIDEEHRIDDGTDSGLSRGFFIGNSEVGKAMFSVTTFYLRHVCGNHIVWGASNVQKTKIVHVGDMNKKAAELLQSTAKQLSEASSTDEEARIKTARGFKLADKKEDVIELVAKKQKLLSGKTAATIYEIAEAHDHVDGAPNTAWGFAQGVTRYSQQFENADRRSDMDAIATKILDMAVN